MHYEQIQDQARYTTEIEKWNASQAVGPLERDKPLTFGYVGMLAEHLSFVLPIDLELYSTPELTERVNGITNEAVKSVHETVAKLEALTDLEAKVTSVLAQFSLGRYHRGAQHEMYDIDFTEFDSALDELRTSVSVARAAIHPVVIG